MVWSICDKAEIYYLQRTLQGKLVCVLLLGFLLCWRHDFSVNCSELVVVGEVGRQHKRKDCIVRADISWMMSRRGTEKGWEDAVRQ